MINVMKNVMAVLAVGFALAGCGVAPDDELLQLSSTEAALASGDPTTRAVCVACGCAASDVACDCGADKLDCINKGGSVEKVSPDGIATSPGKTVVETSGSARRALLTKGGWYCLPWEDVYCSGIPPVCRCVPHKIGTFSP
jgi:hypothetical protein